MPEQRRAPSLPQQPAWAIEERRNPIDSIDTDAPGSEFERKGNSVKLAAHLADDRRVGVIQLETALCSCSLNKQLHGWKGQRLCRRQRFIISAERQRMYSIDLVTFDLQRFPARSPVIDRCHITRR